MLNITISIFKYCPVISERINYHSRNADYNWYRSSYSFPNKRKYHDMTSKI